MFSYNEETQSYNFSLLGDEKSSKKVDPKTQELLLLSDFKILQEPQFHDLWFCEYDFCENSFWFGGKHHCRVCGNTVCSDHCVENVVLSTRTMPVLIDKLPNATRPILAANKDKLPESLEFKRACLKCCNLAKLSPEIKKSKEELKREKEERRKKRAEKKLFEDNNHWTNDNELIEKVNIMKAKKESRKPKNTTAGGINSPTEEYKTETSVKIEDIQNEDKKQNGKQKEISNNNISVKKTSTVAPRPTATSTTTVPAKQQPTSILTPQRDPPIEIRTTQAVRAEELLNALQGSEEVNTIGTTEQQSKAAELLQRASVQLSAARNTHTIVLQEKQKRGIKLNSQEQLQAEQLLAASLSTEELALLVRQKERLIAEAEKKRTDAEVALVQSKANENIDVVLMNRNVMHEEQELQEDGVMFAQEEGDITSINLSSTTVLLSNAFQAAVESNDETAIQVAAADLIAQAWRNHVSYRRRRAQQKRRRAFLERINACRIQSWIRAKLAHLRFIANRRLRETIAAAEAQALVAQQEAMAQLNRLSGVFLAYVAKHRFRQRLDKLPRIVVIDKIAVGTSYSSQQVMVARQSGCVGLESLHGSARNAVIARSKAEVLFKTKEDVFASNTVCHERCLLTGVVADSTLCVTLLNPTSFVQSLVNVRDHMTKLNSSRTATVSPLPVEAVLVPTLDSSGKSAIPANLGTTPDDHPGLRYLTMKAAPYAYSHAGYVSKQTHSLKGEFKERYLVLVDGKLWLFKDALSLHEPKDSLLCANIKVFKFGHDKSAEGKLTVHLSDGKEDWYLRFPNTDRHTSSVECRTWLRKIQYACPHTRLNGCAELDFVQLLVRMGSAEGAPVLRPSTQKMVMVSMFGSHRYSKPTAAFHTALEVSNQTTTEQNQNSTNTCIIYVDPSKPSTDPKPVQISQTQETLIEHTEGPIQTNSDNILQESSTTAVSVKGNNVPISNTSLLVDESTTVVESTTVDVPASSDPEAALSDPDPTFPDPVSASIPDPPVRMKPPLPDRPLPDMTQFHQVAPGLGRAVLIWNARLHMRRRLQQLPHVLVVENIQCAAVHCTQYVIVHSFQQGSDLLSTTSPESLYCTGDLPLGTSQERCLLSNIMPDTAVCATLVKPNAFVQSIMTLKDMKLLYSYHPVTVAAPIIESTTIPVVDLQKKSLIPANVGNAPTPGPGFKELTLRLVPHTFSQSGWLLKQAHSVVGEFKARYFVLVAGQLQYFSDTLSLHAPKGSIRCSEVSVFEYGHDKSAQGELTIRLVAGTDDWYLRFPKDTKAALFRTWLRKLQYACPQAPMNSSTLPFLDLLGYIGSSAALPILRPSSTTQRFSGMYSLAVSMASSPGVHTTIPVSVRNKKSRGMRAGDAGSSAATLEMQQVDSTAATTAEFALTMPAVRNMLRSWLARRQLRNKIAVLPRIISIKSITAHTAHCHQQVIVHILKNTTLSTSNNTEKAIFCTKQLDYEAGKVFPEQCILSGVCATDSICLTLLKPNSFIQYVIPLHQYSALFHCADALSLTSLAPESAMIPVLDATGRSLIPDNVGTVPDKVPGLASLTLQINPHTFSQCGWLLKQARSVVGEFKARYFVLVAGQLQYFSDTMSLHAPKGSIRCSEVSVFEYGHDKSAQGELTIRLVVGAEDWYLRFPKDCDQIVVSAWLRKLQYACPQAPMNSVDVGQVELLEYVSFPTPVPVLRPSSVRVLSGLYSPIMYSLSSYSSAAEDDENSPRSISLHHSGSNTSPTKMSRISAKPALTGRSAHRNSMFGPSHHRNESTNNAIEPESNVLQIAAGVSDETAPYAQSMIGVRRLVLRWRAQRHYHRILSARTHILLVEQVTAHAKHSSQQVILHQQSGLENLPTASSAEEHKTLLAHSTAQTAYCTKPLTFTAGRTFSDRCVLTNIHTHDVLGVTLIKSNSFVQSVIQLDKYPSLLHGLPVTVTDIAAECSLVPVLDAAGRSLIPENVGTVPEEGPGLARLTLKLAPHTFSQSGWLLKQAHSVVGEFKARYFVLVAGQLQYFSDTLSLHAPKGSIRCSEVSVFEYGHDKSAQGELTIRLVAGTDDWYLRFPKETSWTEAGMWLRKLQYACTQVRANNVTLSFTELIESLGAEDRVPAIRFPQTTSRRLSGLYSPIKSARNLLSTANDELSESDNHNRGRTSTLLSLFSLANSSTGENESVDIAGQEEGVVMEHSEDVDIEDRAVERASLRSAELNSSMTSPAGVRVGDDGSSIGGRRLSLKSMKKWAAHMRPVDKPLTETGDRDREPETEEAGATVESPTEERKPVSIRRSSLQTIAEWTHTLLPLSPPHKGKTEANDKEDPVELPVSAFSTYAELGLGDLSDSTAEFAGSMPAVRRILRAWLIRHRTAKLPRVLLLTNICTTELCSSQQVIAHIQRGLHDWATTAPEQRKALLARSKADVVFCSAPLEARHGKVFPDQCILSNVHSGDVLCVTLIKSNSYTQSVIPLAQFSELSRGDTVQVTAAESQCWPIPVLDAAGRSLVPNNVGAVPEDKAGIASITLKFASLAVSQSGCLLKQAHSVVGEFKARYFVLTAGQLQYFSDTLSLHAPKGSIRCSEVSVFEYGHDKSAQGELTIRIVAGTDDWYLRFPKDCDQIVVNAWLRKLQYACHQAPLNSWDKSQTDAFFRSQEPSNLPILRPSSTVRISSLYSRSVRGSTADAITSVSEPENDSCSTTTLPTDLFTQSMPAVRRMLCAWLRRHRQRHIVLVEHLTAAETHSSLQVIVHSLPTPAPAESNSRAEALYRSAPMEFSSTPELPDSCVIAGARRQSVLCVTLLKPTSFSQYLIPLSSHPELFHGAVVRLEELSAVQSAIPVLDAADRSLIPENVGTIPEEGPGLAMLTLKLAPHTFSQSGWLLKQARSVVGEFKARYFVLVAGQLQYFFGTLSLHAPKGSIRCSEVSVFEYGHDKSAQGELTIRLVAGAEDWYLRFPKDCDQVVVSAWLRKLQYACPQAPVNGSLLTLAERVEGLDSTDITVEVQSPRASRRLSSFYSPKASAKRPEHAHQDEAQASAGQEGRQMKPRRLSFESVTHWTKALLPHHDHHHQQEQQLQQGEEEIKEAKQNHDEESLDPEQSTSTNRVDAEEVLTPEDRLDPGAISSEKAEPCSERSIAALEVHNEATPCESDTRVQGVVDTESLVVSANDCNSDMIVEDTNKEEKQDRKSVGNKRSSFQSILSWGKALLHTDTHKHTVESNKETDNTNAIPDEVAVDSEPVPEQPEVLNSTIAATATDAAQSVDETTVVHADHEAATAASSDLTATDITADEPSTTTKKKPSQRRLSLKSVTNWGKSLFPSITQHTQSASSEQVDEAPAISSVAQSAAVEDSEDAVPCTPTKPKPQPSEKSDSISSRTSTPYAPSATQLLARKELSAASSDSSKERSSESSDWSAVDEQDPLILEIAAEEAAAREAEQREIDALAVPVVKDETTLAIESAETAAALVSVLDSFVEDTTSVLADVNTLQDGASESHQPTSEAVRSMDEVHILPADAVSETAAATTVSASVASVPEIQEPTVSADENATTADAAVSVAVESKEEEQIALPVLAEQPSTRQTEDLPAEAMEGAAVATTVVEQGEDGQDEPAVDQETSTAAEVDGSNVAPAGKKKKPKKKKGGKK